MFTSLGAAGFFMLILLRWRLAVKEGYYPFVAKYGSRKGMLLMEWLDTIKKVALTVKRIGEVDLYNQLIELQDEIMAVKHENHKLVDENRKLK